MSSSYLFMELDWIIILYVIDVIYNIRRGCLGTS